MTKKSHAASASPTVTWLRLCGLPLMEPGSTPASPGPMVICRESSPQIEVKQTDGLLPDIGERNIRCWYKNKSILKGYGFLWISTRNGACLLFLCHDLILSCKAKWNWDGPIDQKLFTKLIHSQPLVAQLVRNLPTMWRPGFNSWVGKIPWRRQKLPTPVFWPGEFHGLQQDESPSLSADV